LRAKYIIITQGEKKIMDNHGQNTFYLSMLQHKHTSPANTMQRPFPSLDIVKIIENECTVLQETSLLAIKK
jgi:hypothetical protein